MRAKYTECERRSSKRRSSKLLYISCHIPVSKVSTSTTLATSQARSCIFPVYTTDRVTLGKLCVDSQNEARATGSSVMKSRRAMEPLAKFTLRTHRKQAARAISGRPGVTSMKLGSLKALPVEGGHCADGQQHVEQRLGGVRQAVVLLQQVGQSGEVLPG